MQLSKIPFQVLIGFCLFVCLGGVEVLAAGVKYKGPMHYSSPSGLPQQADLDRAGQIITSKKTNISEMAALINTFTNQLTNPALTVDERQAVLAASRSLNNYCKDVIEAQGRRFVTCSVR